MTTASIRRVPLSTLTDAAAERSATLRVAGIGTHVNVNVRGSRSAEILPVFTRAWERCISPAITQAGSASQVVTISLRAHEEQPEHGVDVTSESIDALMTAATQVITHAFIAAQTGRLLMLHAGAVAHPVTNRALVYVAAGGTGKTTFTRLLGTHYRYLTDETVAVDEQHRVLPYPKPLSIRVPGSRYKAETPPDDLGILPPMDPPRW